MTDDDRTIRTASRWPRVVAIVLAVALLVPLVVGLARLLQLLTG